MCLTSITTKHEDCPIPDEKIGYKVFKYGIYSKLGGPFFDFNILFNKWNTALNHTTSSTDRQYYKTGFHIFTNKQDAENYAKELLEKCNILDLLILQVKYRNVICVGKQGVADCVVANKMMPMLTTSQGEYNDL